MRFFEDLFFNCVCIYFIFIVDNKNNFQPIKLQLQATQNHHVNSWLSRQLLDERFVRRKIERASG